MIVYFAYNCCFALIRMIVVFAVGCIILTGGALMALDGGLGCISSEVGL